jgi:hypothetical protein
LTKECHIRAGWARRQDAGWKLFLWQLGYGLAMLAGLIVLLGIPAALAYSMGWFTAPGNHVLALVLGGTVVFGLFVVFIVAATVIHVFTKDFVVPQMALEGISALEGWRRLWPMMQTEKSGYAIYVGMKIVLAFGASIVIGIASLLLGLIIALPAIGVAIAAAVTGKTAGLNWNAFTITAAIVGGCILLAVFLYLIAMISVPAIVFFPAYSMYFFAPRYRALSLALYPPPPSSGILAPPPDLPPSPDPQPAG